VDYFFDLENHHYFATNLNNNAAANKKMTTKNYDLGIMILIIFGNGLATVCFSACAIDYNLLEYFGGKNSMKSTLLFSSVRDTSGSLRALQILKLPSGQSLSFFVFR
jgi:hypothetical protein